MSIKVRLTQDGADYLYTNALDYKLVHKDTVFEIAGTPLAMSERIPITDGHITFWVRPHHIEDINQCYIDKFKTELEEVLK